MEACVVEESSIFAFSAASFRRCRAILSWRRSMPPLSAANLSAIQSMTRWSQSSPPRWLSPAVDRTSNTPSPSSSTETSNVPPPRSNTRIFSIFVHLVEAVGQGSRGRLVDDTFHLEASDLASVFGGLALSVVEVCGNGNDGLSNRAGPRCFSASAFSFCRTMAEISSGVYSLPSMSTTERPSLPFATL